MNTALLTGRWWRAVGAVLAPVALLAAAACKHADDARDDEHTSLVWAVDVDWREGRNLLSQATRVGDHDEITLPLTVFGTVCYPRADDYVHDRGGYGHTCNPLGASRGGFGEATGWNRGKLEELDRYNPGLRVRELTVTATVVIVSEYVTWYPDGSLPRTQQLETLWTGKVGPLSMYEAKELDPIVARFEPDQHASAYRSQPRDPYVVAGPYQVYAKIRDCRLSNGSACGNNSRRFEFRPDRGIGTSEQGLGGAGAGVTIPDRAGGLTGLKLGSGHEGGRATQPNQDQTVGGVPVRRTVQGLFQAGDGHGRVFFWGVELAEPQSPQAIDRSGEAMVRDAFGLGATAGGMLAPRSEPRQYDSGPLGGQVWCQTFEHNLLAQTSYACGWVDQTTVGTISVGHDAIKDLRLTEADAAALLVRMRADIETAR